MRTTARDTSAEDQSKSRGSAAFKASLLAASELVAFTVSVYSTLAVTQTVTLKLFVPGLGLGRDFLFPAEDFTTGPLGGVWTAS